MESIGQIMLEASGLCRGREQAEEVSSSLLRTMAGIQESASRSQQHSFSRQADSLMQHYQTRLAQVCSRLGYMEQHTMYMEQHIRMA